MRRPFGVKGGWIRKNRERGEGGFILIAAG
jgi:hypothetical protein